MADVAEAIAPATTGDASCRSPSSGSVAGSKDSGKRSPCPPLESTPSPPSKRRRFMPSRYVAGEVILSELRSPPLTPPRERVEAEEVRYWVSPTRPGQQAVVVWFEEGTDDARKVFASATAQLEATALMQHLETNCLTSAMLFDGQLVRLYAYNAEWEARLCARLVKERHTPEEGSFASAAAGDDAVMAGTEGPTSSPPDPADLLADCGRAQLEPTPPATPPRCPAGSGASTTVKEAEEEGRHLVAGRPGAGETAAVLWFEDGGEKVRNFLGTKAKDSALKAVRRLEARCLTCAAVVGGRAVQWYAYNGVWERRLCSRLVAKQLVSGPRPLLEVVLADAPLVPVSPTKALLQELDGHTPVQPAVGPKAGLSYFVALEGGEFVLEFFHGSTGLQLANERFDEASSSPAMAVGGNGHIVRLHAPDSGLHQRLCAFLKDNELDR